MKNSLIALASALIIGMSTELYAENKVYTYFDEDGLPVYGQLARVSPNGLWACGGDEDDETGAFVVNTQDPENLKFTPQGLLLDIDNNGLAVGCYYHAEGYAKYKKAATYKDGEWSLLPLPEEIIGQSHAIAISADSRTIAGHGLCRSEDPSEPGKYYPIIWTLNEESGRYELKKLYNNIWVPGTNGFFVSDMTPNAKYVCGTQWLDFGDTVDALLNVETGELTKFHEIEIKPWDFEVGTFDNMFVDGIMDGFDEDIKFGGMFIYATDRYVYGSHAVVTSVMPDGSGEIENYASIYDLEEGKFIDGEANGYIYLSGTDANHVFTNRGLYIENGKKWHINEYIGTNVSIHGITSIDDAGRVLTGGYVFVSPLGDQIASPVLVLLDDESAIAGISNVSVDNTVNAKVRVDGNAIVVEGAEKVAIYDTNGCKIANTAKATVAPGIYVVVADGVAKKVIVK